MISFSLAAVFGSFAFDSSLYLADGRVSGEVLQLDLSNLPKGIYYLGVEKAGVKEMFKLIKR